MGKEKSQLTDTYISALERTTHFDSFEIKGIHHRFEEIANAKYRDGVVHKEEFFHGLGLKETQSIFLHSMFEQFDRKGNDVLDFDEFIQGLSVFSPRASLDEKIEFAFNVFDIENSGFITKPEITKLLESSLRENGMTLSEEEVKEIVDQTFEDVDSNKDGNIYLADFREMIHKHPTMIEQTMTMDTRLFHTAETQGDKWLQPGHSVYNIDAEAIALDAQSRPGSRPKEERDRKKKKKDKCCVM